MSLLWVATRHNRHHPPSSLKVSSEKFGGNLIQTVLAHKFHPKGEKWIFKIKLYILCLCVCVYRHLHVQQMGIYTKTSSTFTHKAHSFQFLPIFTDKSLKNLYCHINTEDIQQYRSFRTNLQYVLACVCSLKQLDGVYVMM